MPNLDLRDLPGVTSFWDGKEILDAGEFEALAAEMKAKAFALADVWDKRLLNALYESLTTAIRGAQTTKEWRVEADRILAAYGGEVYSGSDFSAWYADLVMRQNALSAYAAGRYAEMFNGTWLRRAPFWLYATAQDDRVRPEHAALDGKVFRKDDPVARKFLPPWDYNCRCQAIELDVEDLAAGGYAVSQGGTVGVDPASGFDVDQVVSLVPMSIGRAA